LAIVIKTNVTPHYTAPHRESKISTQSCRDNFGKGGLIFLHAV